jgi:hypothetical protein
MAINQRINNQNTTSGPAESSSTQRPSPPTTKRDLGQDFRRLGDERLVDPKYFKVCLVSLLCILWLDSVVL